MTCNHCQEQLLNFLYDVLDDAERAPIAAHLDECPMCQSARNGLRAQQELLAEAAKESFTAVSFQPPIETPKRLGEPTLAMPRRQRGFSWVRVALAASIVLFVFGGGTMGVMGWFRTRDEIEVAEARVLEAKKQETAYQEGVRKHQQQTQDEIRAIQEQIDKLFKDWNRDAQQQNVKMKKEPAVQIVAPPSAAGQPIPVEFHFKGAAAPNGLETAKKAVRSADQGGARGQLQVLDAYNNTVYQQPLDNLQRQNLIKVPPQPFQPNNRYTLVGEVFDKDGNVVARDSVELKTPEYLTHLATDRPMYRPGEVVRFRSLTLERFSLKPPQEDLHLVYRILAPNQQELEKIEGASTLVTGPNAQPGNAVPVKGPDGKPLRGLGGGEYQLPVDAAGGQYTLIVGDAQNRFPPEKRAFLVNQWQMPRMNKELKFHRSSYGPGELVEVHALAKRNDGGPLAGQPAHARAMVDGRPVLDQRLTTKADGSVVFSFKLPPPELIPSGQATCSVAFEDGAGPEPIVKPIPIVLNKLHVEFFPEGGDLVVGVPNKVYFQAKNTLGKPAELTGRLVDQNGAAVATLQTLHDDREEGINQGQGSFTFVPAAGKKYSLKIDTPLGAKPQGQFPATQADGVVLHLTRPVAADTIECEVTSASAQRSLMVGAYCRGRLIDERRIGAPAGKPQTVTLKTNPDVSGVYRITVYEIVLKGDDMQYVPRAERLTYRQGTEHLKVAVEGVDAPRAPGDQVKLRLNASNEAKQRTPAVALVSVVDQSLLKLADDKTERGMPTHFLLTTEIRQPEDFENADALLGTHPKAATALDLLLGTQGWRRFAEQDPKKFQDRNRDAQRILVHLAAPGQRRDEARDAVADKVDKVYARTMVKLQDDLAHKEAVENGPADRAQQQQAIQMQIQQASVRLADARSSLQEYEQRMFQYLLGAVVIAALVAGLLAIGFGVRRMGQGRPPLALLVTGTALLLFLFMGSLAGVFYMIGSKGEQPWMIAKGPPMPQDVAKAAPPMAAMANEDAPPPPPVMMAVPAPPGGREMPDNAADQKGDGVGVELEKGAAMADRMAMDKVRPRMLAPAPPPGGMVAPALPGAAMAQQGGAGGQANMMQLAAPGGPPAQFQMQNDAALRQGNFGAGGGFGPMAGRGQNQNMLQERALRQQKNYGAIIEQQMKRRIALPQPTLPLYVREYAHRHIEQQDNVRRDFTETVGWWPALVMPGGTAEIAFDLSDAVTRYQVTVFSHSLDGRLGADRFELSAKLPFSIDPKVPFEVSSTDKLVLPVAVKNDTAENGQIELSVRATGLKKLDAQARDASQSRDVFVDAKSTGRGYFAYEPAIVAGNASVRVKGTLRHNQLSDTVEREFKIVPDGFPIRGAQSGLLEKTAIHEIVLPGAWVPGTLQCQVQVFPSTLAELQKGLEGLLREPCGCFEQSSSSNYPNVLILNYLKEVGQGDPNIEKRARSLIAGGYQRITSFECLDPKEASTRRGYEWFGQTAPPHEALTAYGLLQFHDMAKVYSVDAAMVERTRKYLLGQRDGQGGFQRNARALDSFGRAPQHITNAYIVWALTDAGGDEDLSKELSALAARAKDSKDPYFIALVALGHLYGGKADEALTLAKKLKGAQKDDGRLDGTETSITGSQGRDLALETTALAVLGWLKANRPDEFHTSIDKAIKWIGAQRSGQGSFGATQSTILALKALIAHTREAKKIAEDGKLTVTLPDRGAKVESLFTAGASEPITLSLLEGKGLQAGKNKVVVETTGKNAFPYTLSWSYQTIQPPSDAGCAVKLSAKLSKQNSQEGDTVKLNATIENATDQGHGMSVAILGLPAGLTIPEDAKQLKELAKLRDGGTKPGVISHWELKGRELVLYWRDLAPRAKIDVELDLICRLPGTYRGPASRAYLYYNADAKTWIEPLAITIDPQRGE